jgi:hypothetical protein
MKLLMAVAFLVGSMSFYVSAEDVVMDRNQENCQDECRHVSYTYRNSGVGFCYQVMSCDLYAWDENQNVCLLERVGERRTYSIACRDVPMVP